MQWTPAQRDAIEARSDSLLVTASAGSGKTAVLTARIVALVKEGVRIDEMLVVTFTKAAAAEMRERILIALHKATEAEDAFLAQQALRVEHADISTLHAFCTKVCREHFQAAGVDPTFRVADAAEAATLRAQALEEAMIACFEQATPAFEHAAASFGQQALMEVTDALHQFLMARPDPWAWLEAAVLAHDVDAGTLAGSLWMRVQLQKAAMDLTRAMDAYDRLRLFVGEHGQHEAFVAAELECARACLKAVNSGYEAAVAFPETSFGRRPSYKDKAVNARFGALRDEAKAALKEAQTFLASLRDLEPIAEAERETVLALTGLAGAARTLADRYTALKEERNLLDFADLEHRALRALRRPEIAAALRAQYRHVFVDEYQDSSMLQEALLEALKGGNSFFLVGDVKQSIYRFRLAEPALFLEKLRTYRADVDADCRKVALSSNFRSHPRLLRAINQAFEGIFVGDAMELPYGAEERLLPGREEAWEGAPVEVHVIGDEAAMLAEASPEETEDGEEILSKEAKASIRQEAEVIADRILALQAAPERAYRLRDMAILMRTVRGKAAQVVDVLRARGIPAWSDLGEDALGRCEVQAILSILQVIDNLHQDVPLLSALRGPALGLSDESLVLIRSAQPEGAVADAVLAYAARENDLAYALRGFMSRIRGWALDAQVLPLDALLRRIYQETGYFAQSGAKPDGAVRQDNLRLLAEHASAYQRAQAGSLGGFLRYLERVKAQEGIAARELGERDDVVRILSIHKSKGLQFPVVFVAGLGRHFGKAQRRLPLQMHAQLGLGMELRRPRLRTRLQTISQRAILERRRSEDIAEEARILYVAMTRAEERLILTGTPRKGELERWALQPQGTAAPLARSMLQWLYPAARNHPQAWALSLHPRSAAASGPAVLASLKEMADRIRTLEPPRDGPVQAALSFTPAVLETPLPIKRSVSTVVKAVEKRGEDEQIRLRLEEVPARPLFMEEKGLTAAERGSAVHAFLSALDLHAEDLASERRRMLECGILSEEQAAALPMQKLRRVVQGALWRRMRDARTLHREWPFNLRRVEEGQRTLLQGVIDVCFIEEGAWVLVDYKSDRATDVQALIARYRPQLQLYAMALARMTGLPVKERILYLVDAETGYEVTD